MLDAPSGSGTPRTLGDVLGEAADIADELADLQSPGGGTGEAVTEAKEALDPLRDFLDKTKTDIGDSKEKIEEAVGDLKDLGEGFKELFEDPDVKTFIDGVDGGLSSAENVTGKITDTLDDVNEALDALDKIDDLSSEDAQAQLESFAEVFETAVDKLGPFIKLVPVLGDFLQIYAAAIRNIAQNAGVITGIIYRNIDLHADMDPTATMLVTPETARRDRIEALEAKWDARIAEAREITDADDAARADAELNFKNTDVENAVKLALKDSGCEAPGPNSPAEKARDSAATTLKAADSARSAASGNLWDASQASPETKERLEAELKDAKEKLDTAQDSFDSAQDRVRDEWAAYNDCVKGKIAIYGRYANKTTGFNDHDYIYLAYTYPQWTITPASGDLLPPVRTKSTKKVVWIGGAALAGMMLIGAMLILPVGQTTPQPTTPATTIEDDTAEVPPTSDTSATAQEDETVVEQSDEAAVEPIIVFLACPISFVQDTTGKRPSGKDGEVPEAPTETAEAKASNVICSRFNTGSYVFTAIVEGDGETLSMSDNTVFDLRFVVNNDWPDNVYYDDTGFEVLVAWNRNASQFTGFVNGSDRSRLPEADIDIAWLGSSTIQVTVDLPGDDVEVTNMRVELNVLIQDDNQRTTYTSRDIALWTPAP